MTSTSNGRNERVSVSVEGPERRALNRGIPS